MQDLSENSANQETSGTMVNQLSRSKSNNILYTFFYLFVAELVLCGSGQLIHVYGGLTLRMFLFAIALCFSFVFALRKKMPADVCNIFLFYNFTLIVGTSFALITGHRELLFLDLKPLIFFWAYPFIFWMLDSPKVIDKVSSIIKIGSLVMAIAYLIYLVAIKLLGLIDFITLYGNMSDQSDFMFRGANGEFFYKGFVFLPIGLLFWYKDNNKIALAILLAAIFFTLTRGFYIMAFCALLFSYYKRHKVKIGNILALFLLVGAILGIASYAGVFDLFEGRSAESDSIRFLQIEQVFERMNLFSFLVGHGFGYGVPVREIHMEIAYLEILHKQGLLGLIFWFTLIYEIYKENRYAKREYKEVSDTYAIGALVIYIQSMFNPYLNNPIGMSFIIIAYCVCRKLSVLHENPVHNSYIQSTAI